MDHLPVPSNPCKPTFNVPLVSKASYSLGKGPFHEFPSRHLESLQNDRNQLTLSPDKVFLSVIQSWLFFGVITEFFQEEVDVQDFTKPSQDGSSVICTSPLLPLKERWLASHAFRTGDDRQNTFYEHIVILIQALYACEQLEKSDFGIPDMKTILVSVRLLICSLVISILTLTKRSRSLESAVERLRFIPHGSRGGQLREFQFLDHMVLHGWCPFQVEQLLRTCCATSIYYFACIDRRRPFVSHAQCLEAGSCIVHNLDANSFRYSHTYTGCQCSPIGIDENKMMKILEEGGIPLVHCLLSQDGKVTPHIIKADRKMKYTAVSHVWIDGLGNPRENKISQCQFLRLISRIRKLGPPELQQENFVILWIDTFCIPVESADGRIDRRTELRRKAINLMTPTYAKAQRVLVLDSELDKISHLDISFAELTARLWVCGWVGRAWTLQEGSLASRLCFHFRNSFLFAYEGQRSFDEALKIAGWNGFHDEQTQMLQECRSAWFLPAVGRYKPDPIFHLSSRDVQFMEVWNSLLNKDTTKPDDLYVILANLLDFGISEIRNLGNGQEKMKSMVLQQDRLPVDLLCLPTIQHASPSNNQTTLSWIPSRPMSLRLSRSSFIKTMRRVRGGFELDMKSGPSGYVIKTTDFPLQNFCLAPIGPGALGHPKVSVSLVSNLDLTGEAPKELYLYFATLAGHALLRDTNHFGACFAICKRTKRRLLVRYMGSLEFSSCLGQHGQDGLGLPHTVTASPVGSDISILVETESCYRPKFRRPLNVASLGTAITPMKRLGYFIAVLLWGVFSFIVYLFMSIEFAWIVIAAGGLVFSYYGYKYFFAYRSWLDSYVKPGPTTFIKLFNLEQQVKMAILQSGMAQRWLRYSRPRTERWNRIYDDVRAPNVKPKTLQELRWENAPELFEFGIGVQDTVLNESEMIIASNLLEDEKINFLQSLSFAMARTPH